MSESTVIQFGASGTSGDIGAVIELQDRGNGKKDLLLTTPLSVEINIDNNNSPADEVKFTAGSGANKKVLAILDENGNLKIRGKVMQDSNLD